MSHKKAVHMINGLPILGVFKMKKTIKRSLFLLVFISNLVTGANLSDAIFVNRIIISNTAKRAILNSISPGDNVAMISNKDDIMLYYADVGVLNPTKKKYNIEIICSDKKGNVVIQGSFKSPIDSLKNNISGDITQSLFQSLTLDPKVGAMVPSQLIPLKNHTDYYIKLFVEKQLIGISDFTYEIEQ